MTPSMPSTVQGTTMVPIPGRNTNAFVANLVDREPARYWDTVLAATGTPLSGTFFCFASQIGMQNQALTGNAANTKLQTNMQKANEFPPPRCLLLGSVCFQYSPLMTYADMQLVENAAYMEFKISDKIFHEGYLRDFPAGAGLVGFSTNNGTDIVNNGPAAPNFQRSFGSWSKYIPPSTRFSLNIIFNGSQNLYPGGTGTVATPTLGGPFGLNMRVVLDGISDLPVQ